MSAFFRVLIISAFADLLIGINLAFFRILFILKCSNININKYFRRGRKPCALARLLSLSLVAEQVSEYLAKHLRRVKMFRVFEYSRRERLPSKGQDVEPHSCRKITCCQWDILPPCLWPGGSTSECIHCIEVAQHPAERDNPPTERDPFPAEHDNPPHCIEVAVTHRCARRLI
jgi:hypothetical protein